MPSLKASIAQANPQLQELLISLKNTPTVGKMMLLALEFGQMLAGLVIEEILKERANPLGHWPKCPKCGKSLESKGAVPGQLIGLIGTLCWQRKVGRCPAGCPNTQVVPLDKELGLKPNQRVSPEFKRASCVLVVFVPYQIAAIVLFTVTGVESCAERFSVKEIGQKAIKELERKLNALAEEKLCMKETIQEWIAKLPLGIGGDGVMVHVRPNGGKPAGKTEWMEVNWNFSPAYDLHQSRR